MLTVTLGLEVSGKRRRRSPFGSPYSVIPSTEVILWTPCGRGACWANAGNATSARAAGIGERRRRLRIPALMIDGPEENTVARARTGFPGRHRLGSGGPWTQRRRDAEDYPDRTTSRYRRSR